MKTIQRSHALTAIAPLKPLRLWWCRIVLLMLRMVAMSSSLARLRFIHYGGWFVFGRLPGRRSGRARAAASRARPTMLFMSDYDGDPTEYLAAFGLAVTPGMRWSFGSAAAFPGPKPTRSFIGYVEEHQVEELLRYAAYPSATVRDIDVALEVADRIERVNALTDTTGTTIAFEVHYRALVRVLAQAPEPPQPSLLTGFWRALWNRSSVAGLCAVVPIEASRKEEIAAGIEALSDDPESLFKSVGGVHFARLAVLPVPARGSGRSPRAEDGGPADPVVDCLLFSAWFDGSGRQFVNRLVTGLGHQADAIWDGCPGFPGSDDPRQLASWINAHRLRPSLFLGSRSGRSAEEIQDALRLTEHVREVLTATQGRPLAEVREALADLPGRESHAATT